MKVYKRYAMKLTDIFAPGYKMWSNGLCIKLDTYQSCTNYCKYCYAEELRKASLGRNWALPDRNLLRCLDVKKFADFVNVSFGNKKGKGRPSPFLEWSIRTKKYIEIGTTGETFQNADLETHITENFLRIASECGFPLFINTKGNLLCRNERYQRMIQDYKAPIIFQISFTTTDDKIAKVTEPLAPLPSERMKAFGEFAKLPHVYCTAYISPFTPGVTNLDTEKFITDLVSHNIVGGHVRDFFIQGTRFFDSSYWQDYLERNEDDLEAFPGGYHVTRKARLKFMAEATRIGVRLNPNFRLVGLKTKFFDVDSNHGKMVYDVLDDNFKEGIADFTVIPILRKIKRSPEEPQLLLWDKMGYKRDKIKHPPLIFSREGNNDCLLTTTVCINASTVTFTMDGFEWLKRGLWTGFLKDQPSGFLSEMEGMYPVKSNGEYYKVDGDYAYAYVPADRPELLAGTGLFPGDVEHSQFVDYEKAKNFMVPERPGGTEDKWLTKEELAEQTERLKGAESDDIPGVTEKVSRC